MLLKKCPKCSEYTLENECKKCKEKTKEAGIKYRERFVKESKQLE